MMCVQEVMVTDPVITGGESRMGEERSARHLAIFRARHAM